MIETDRFPKEPVRRACPHASHSDEQWSDRPRPLMDFTRQGVAAHAGHVHVSDDHIRSKYPAHIKSLIAAQERVHLVAFVFQDRRQSQGRVFIVVHDKHAEWIPSSDGASIFNNSKVGQPISSPRRERRAGAYAIAASLDVAFVAGSATPC